MVRRPNTAQPAPPSQSLRINDAIDTTEVHLIDAQGANKGVVSRSDALLAAQTAGLDLVEIAPEAAPPVCKLLDYGKFKYRAQKKASEVRKKQKTTDVKEVKMRPTIDTHDYDVKIRNMMRFFEHGDKVKVTLRFRGREVSYQHLALDLMTRVRETLEKMAKVEVEPKMEGRQMVMIMAPNPTAPTKPGAGGESGSEGAAGKPDTGAEPASDLQSDAKGV